MRKVLSLLQGVLSRAVILGRLQVNPVAAIRKPVQRRKRAVKPLAPAAVEQLRQQMPTERDATLLSLQTRRVPAIVRASGFGGPYPAVHLQRYRVVEDKPEQLSPGSPAGFPETGWPVASREVMAMLRPVRWSNTRVVEREPGGFYSQAGS